MALTLLTERQRNDFWFMEVGVIELPLHHYTQTGQHRFREFVSDCGGVYEASVKLDVPSFFINQILRDEPVPDDILDRTEQEVGPIRLLKRTQFDSPLSNLRSTLEISGSLHGATQQRVVNPSTVKKRQKELPTSTQRNLGISSEEGGTSYPPSHTRTNSISALTSKLRDIVKSDMDMFDLASKCGVTETSLRKLYKGIPVTQVLARKVEAALACAKLTDEAARPSPATERLRTIHELYSQLGTLEGVGKQVGLTRERVRQLLVKGKKIGLFEYNPREYPYVSKERLIEDFKKTQSSNRVAHLNNISPGYLKQMLTAYSITEKQLCDYRLEGKRAKCIEQYNRMVESSGHHLSSGELQRRPTGRALYARITRFWGSIDAFREELNIPAIARIRPHWLDSWRQIALVKRMQHLDALRECLTASTPWGITELCLKSNFGGNRVRRLLTLLIATGEVKKVGQLSNTKYLLANN